MICQDLSSMYANANALIIFLKPLIARSGRCKEMTRVYAEINLSLIRRVTFPFLVASIQTNGSKEQISYQATYDNIKKKMRTFFIYNSPPVAARLCPCS